MNKNVVSDALRSGLGKKTNPLVRALELAVGAAVFFIFARYARYAKIDDFSGYKTSQMQMLSGVVFGASDARAGAVCSCLEGLDYAQTGAQPWSYGGVEAAACAEILREFFRERR